MNISISEIIVILLVALLVIKPDQLPGVAFKLGKWAKMWQAAIGKWRRELDGAVNQLTHEVSGTTKPEKTETPHEPRHS